MSEWSNRIVLITGASSGLGLELSREFARRGARLILAARNLDKLNAAASQLSIPAENLLTVSCDVTQDADVQNLFDQVREKFGRLDTLVNCAGMSSRGRIVEIDVADLQQMWELNVLSIIRCSKAAFPLLCESKGSIINIGSLAGKIASKFLGGYCTTKYAVSGLSKQMRLEMAEQGVHVLLVCPGPLARKDQGARYSEQSSNLPAEAALPGGGVKIKGIDPVWLTDRIIRGCENREAEIVVPWYPRVLLALDPISNRIGDWLLRIFMKQK